MKHSIPPLRVLPAWLTVAFVACQLIVAGQATTVYVSLSGNDANPGTQARPFATIGYAVAQLDPGETLLVRGGVYKGSANVIDTSRFRVRSGTAASPITISGAPGEVAVIQPMSGPGVRLAAGGRSYLVIQDLVFDGTDSDSPEGVYLSDGTHHIRFQRIEVRNWKNFGMAFSKNNGLSPFNEVLDSKIHHNGSGGESTNGHGIYLTSPDTRIEGSEFYNNLGYGIHVYDDPGLQSSPRTIIRNNRIHHNGRPTQTSFAIILNEARDSIVEGNRLYNNRGGIQVSASAPNARLLYNTIVGNVDYGIELSSPTATVRGNLVYQNGTAITGGGSLVTNNLLTDPRFVNQAAFDFRLRPGSPAMVAGGRDLGALESGEVTPPPVLPPVGPAACVYTVSRPGVQVFGGNGGTTTLTVTTQPGCRWTATDEAPWLTVTPSSGVGTRSLTVTVLAGSVTRTTQVVVAGQVFSVRQAP